MILTAVFRPGPVPMRSFALTDAVLRYACQVFAPSAAEAAIASCLQKASAPVRPPRLPPIPGPLLVTKNDGVVLAAWSPAVSMVGASVALPPVPLPPLPPPSPVVDPPVPLPPVPLPLPPVPLPVPPVPLPEPPLPVDPPVPVPPFDPLELQPIPIKKATTKPGPKKREPILMPLGLGCRTPPAPRLF